jgi:dephospho-CoA kinase
MFLVGLTGGIASGKSTVGDLLENAGARVIDADQVAREVVAPGTKGLALVKAEFGKSVLDAEGSLSRGALAGVVFGDENKRKRLEAILHPLIRERSMKLFQEASSEIVVYQVPLLVEASVDYPFDLVVTVEAGAGQQIERLVETRGLSEQQASSRVQAQASEQQRVARADVRIDSSNSLEQLEKDVAALWLKIQQLSAKKGRDGAH